MERDNMFHSCSTAGTEHVNLNLKKTDTTHKTMVNPSEQPFSEGDNCKYIASESSLGKTNKIP